MVAPAPQERRQDPRVPAAAGLRLQHALAGPGLPARAVNVSRGGMMILAPLTAPLHVGQTLRLVAPPTGRPLAFAPPHLPAEATVVWLDRSELLPKAHLAAGLRFQQAWA